jgi:NitT/TauT family transport system substrate-binding protein
LYGSNAIMVVVRLAVPDLISNSYFPAIAAAKLGFFQQEGLDITHAELFFPVPQTMRELRDGRFDLVAGAAHAALQAFPRWNGVTLLAAVGQHMYWFLVVRAELPLQRGDLGGLRGLRIGAAPGPDLGLIRLLQTAGLDPERDVRVGPVPGTGAASTSFGVTAARALADGLIDGFWANGMGAEVAVREGAGKVILDVRREGPEEVRRYTFPALVARADLPAVAAQAALRGLVRAQQALREDPALASGIGQRLFPPLEASLIAGLIERDAPFYDATISREAFEGLTQFALDVGLLDEPVPYEQVVYRASTVRE